MQEGYVKIKRENEVAHVEFFHPKGNSLPAHLLKDLHTKIEELGHDPEIKVLVLRSGGEKTFCAGAAFDELLKISDLEEGIQFFSGFAHVINAMRKCPKFIIGQVQGKAVGGGVGILAATDYCLATEAAAVRLSELTLGIGPFVIGPVVKRKIGKASFTHLALDATSWYKATWCRDHGLIAEVYPDIATMSAATARLTQQFSAYSHTAMQTLKTTLWEDANDWDQLLISRAEISARLVLTQEAQRIITDIVNKKD